MADSATELILIPGLWLDGSVWADVLAELDRLGRRATALTLPGLDGSTGATLENQIDATLTAVDSVAESGAAPVVVGHSAASTLAWIAADRRPQHVRRAVLIGGFPAKDGSAYADFFPIADGAMPFPGWEPFDGPDSADLDAAARAALDARAIPVPEGVATGIVRLADDARFDVPVTLICPEFGPDDARAWLAAGELPELARTASVSYVDIDSGHWPMLTRPAELARLLDEAADT